MFGLTKLTVLFYLLSLPPNKFLYVMFEPEIQQNDSFELLTGTIVKTELITNYNVILLF